MPLFDTNSHLTTKLHNFDIKSQSNSRGYDQHGFFGTKFSGCQNFLFTTGGSPNERECSGDDWLAPLLCIGFGGQIIDKFDLIITIISHVANL